ncbi:hypothetical protein AgCh_001853 [Apium graveolens]
MDPDRVKLIAIHLEGKALLWHQTYVKRQGQVLLMWTQYAKDITARFGKLYDDPITYLKALVQKGSVQDYHDSFDALTSRSTPWQQAGLKTGMSKSSDLSLVKLLDSYAPIFEDPTTLPPVRPGFDLRIPLKEGTNLINLRSYRYHVVQKMPMTQFLGKNAFEWNDKANVAFEQLKRVMTTPPVLALPDFNEPFLIETDTLGQCMGAVLM